MKVFFKTLLTCMVLIAVSNSIQAAESKNNETMVYIAHDESARLVIQNMLAMFGRKLSGQDIPSQPVSGKFEVKTIADVMAYFKNAYHINWFENGVVVYTYQSGDWKTRHIYVGGDRSNEDWKDLLTSAGLFYKDFSFVFNPDTKELIVSGPTAYLRLVENAFKQNRPDPSEIEKNGVQLMVFRLEHASVEDRLIHLRDTQVTTPGVLTVLLNLLGLPNQSMTESPEVKKSGQLVDRSIYGSGPGAGSPDMLSPRLSQLPISPTSGISGGKPDEKTDQQPVSVTADPRTNSILIRDAGTKYAYYKKLIDQLDTPQPMIEVEAMLVEVSQSALNQLGLEFGLSTNHLLYDFPGSGVGKSSVLQQGVTSIVDPVQFIARLKALSADENAKVLARPTIVTQDNVPAYIDLSQTLYLQIAGERVANVVPITAGSLLQVTPRVVNDNNDEKIFLRIDIQDGTVSDPTDGVSKPKISNTSLSTQALIQREKAILIGGYNREATSVKDYKVPVLGSLPIIGKAFSSTEKQTETMARLFLITPRLIEDPAFNSTSTQKALNKLQMSFQIEDNSLEPTPTLKLDKSISR